MANATAALRLYQLDLNRVYRFFFAYLVLTTARSLLLLPFNVRENTYGLIYLATLPILWVFYILIVLELYSLVLQNYSGIYSLGRWTLYGDGTTASPNYWVWVPAGATPPPPPPLPRR